jgi:hypothetical protein
MEPCGGGLFGLAVDQKSLHDRCWFVLALRTHRAVRVADRSRAFSSRSGDHLFRSWLSVVEESIGSMWSSY